MGGVFSLTSSVAGRPVWSSLTARGMDTSGSSHADLYRSWSGFTINFSNVSRSPGISFLKGWNLTGVRQASITSRRAPKVSLSAHRSGLLKTSTAF
jgi:hypothetical protein